jgi:hypothetical protein
MKPFHLDTNSKIKSGFTLPPGYFESFESKLFEKLKQEKPTNAISINFRKAKWYSMAAAVIIVAVSLPIYNYHTISSLPKPTSDELEYYLDIHPAITSDDIISHLSETDVQTMQINANLKIENIENYLLKTESIEYYLLD